MFRNSWVWMDWSIRILSSISPRLVLYVQAVVLINGKGAENHYRHLQNYQYCLLPDLCKVYQILTDKQACWLIGNLNFSLYCKYWTLCILFTCLSVCGFDLFNIYFIAGTCLKFEGQVIAVSGMLGGVWMNHGKWAFLWWCASMRGWNWF